VFAFVAALILCFWQNHLLLDIVNDPLPKNQTPITLSPTEPFTTTLTVAAYAAILISLPVILFQIYAFVLPAFSPTEKKVALPLLLMVPFLFIAGAVFAYFVVVPAALKFLLNFNDTEFNTQIRARDYYSFVLLTTLAGGIVFQVPVGILGLTRLGIVTPAKLRKNRRYALLGCAVVAAALPGVDPVSMLIEMVPLVLLYELSILLASVFGRSSAETSDRLASAEGS
jgi:sec-independent protein translocase protein TatC